MGLWNNSYAYGAPMPGPFDSHPWQPAPLLPITPEMARETIERAMVQLDEFAIMAALDKLDDDAKRRVLAWLKARCDMTPKEP